MKRRTFLAALLSTTAIKPVGAFWQSRDSNYNKSASVTPPSYTGPGDIVSFTAWWGLRGYTAAYSTGSNPAIDVVDQAGANTLTVNILANGNLDVATIATWVIAHTVTTILVTKMYDQTGGGAHLTQASVGSMPALILAALGTLPIIQFDQVGGDLNLRGTLAGAASQPCSTSTVANRNGATSSFGAVFTGGGNGLYFSNAANNILLFAGGVSGNAPANDSTWHTFETVLNGASSIIMVDGSDTTGLNPGAGSFGTGVSFGDNGSGASPFFGLATETGIKNAGFSSQNRIDLDANQSAYYGI